MANDTKNDVRIDFPEIFQDIEEHCAHNLNALNVADWDRYAIGEVDQNRVYQFVQEASADIANQAHMIKHRTQTGIDALTDYQELEYPELDASYDSEDREVTGPDATTLELNDISGRRHHAEQKLSASDTPDTIELFTIEGLEPENKTRYTVIQTFIKQALVHYVLMKWWLMKIQPQLAESNQIMYKNALDSLIHNSVHNQLRKGERVNMRPTIF